MVVPRVWILVTNNNNLQGAGGRGLGMMSAFPQKTVHNILLLTLNVVCQKTATTKPCPYAHLCTYIQILKTKTAATSTSTVAMAARLAIKK